MVRCFHGAKKPMSAVTSLVGKDGTDYAGKPLYGCSDEYMYTGESKQRSCLDRALEVADPA